MVKKLINSLDKSNQELSILITIPSSWNDFIGLEMLKKSKYLTFIQKIEKNKAIYFDYYTHKLSFFTW
jgi:hypothetical protein